MDYCVDCNRKLQDLICRSCKMIFVPQLQPHHNCHNCAQSMLQPSLSSPFRYTCQFCLYRYFAFGDYDPSLKTRLEEYMNSLERPCSDCNCRMTLNPQTQELVCKNCGLVHEDPIYTRL